MKIIVHKSQNLKSCKILTWIMSFFKPLSEVIPLGTFKALTKASANGVNMGNNSVFAAD